jgi:hypothetical protein
MVPGATKGIPMKKQPKKLKLTKETVRSLEALESVRGGTGYPVTDHSCNVFCQDVPFTTNCA